MACGLCGMNGHRRETCGNADQMAAVAKASPLKTSGPIRMRQLTKQERALVFSGIDLIYLDAVREMDGGVAYGIPINGGRPTIMMDRLNTAAAHLGLKLVWAKHQKGASEMFCELGE